ncbi:MAG: NAD(P)H-dependent oxidoreductase [Hyphomicrobiales bacterium]
MPTRSETLFCRKPNHDCNEVMALPLERFKGHVLKVLIFLGFTRENSLMRALAERAAAELKSRNLGVDRVDPQKRPLPITDPTYRRRVEEPPNDAVQGMVRQVVATADGILPASPTYHRSYSGVRKNADRPPGL